MDAMRWPVLPLQWRRGFQYKTNFTTWIGLDRLIMDGSDAVNNYAYAFGKMEKPWNEYAEAGEPGSVQQRLGEFMRAYGPPLTAAPGLTPEHWKDVRLSPSDLVIEEPLDQLILEAHNAHTCASMVNTARRGWLSGIADPFELQLNIDGSNAMARFEPPQYRTKDYKRKVHQAVYSFVRVVAAHYVPELSVRLIETEDGMVFGHSIPGLKPALWLAFLSMIPGQVSPEHELLCRRSECGKPFKSEQPNTLYCPSCLREIKAQRMRDKRARWKAKKAAQETGVEK